MLFVVRIILNVYLLVYCVAKYGGFRVKTVLYTYFPLV